MNVLTTVVFVAVVVEAVIEYGKSICGMFEAKDYKTGATQLFSVALGVGLSFSVGLAAFHTLGVALPPGLDMALTGVLLSRGSNYVSDLLSGLAARK